MQDLGTLGGTQSFSSGINDSAQVVGTSNDHAFLWQSDSGMQDLNALLPPDSRWTLREARTINYAGQIVGTGINPDGEQHAFLLTPDGGGAPRGRMKSSVGIDPAVVKVLASFAGHDIPGFAGSVALFQNTQADPVPRETVSPIQGEPAPPNRGGLIPQRVSTQRQAQDVLFAASDLNQTASRWSGWELDLLALELSQPE